MYKKSTELVLAALKMKIITTVILLIGLATPFSSGKVLPPGIAVDNPCPPGEVSWRPTPCTHCSCVNGESRCVIQDCAAPYCENYVVPQGRCCPVCPPGDCNPTGKVFYTNNLLSWKPDPCTHCSCVNGKTQCFVRGCAAPSCSNYIIPEGECCPTCPDLFDGPNYPGVRVPQEP